MKLREEHTLIVVATQKYYNEIAKQLQEYGLKEFDDFLYYECIGKKLALIHGNCHTLIVKAYLELSHEFTEIYFFYPIPLICYNEKKTLDNNVLKHCSLFIHQAVQKNNSYSMMLSSEYLITCLDKDCEQIAMPNVLNIFKAFFPQVDYKPENIQRPLGENIDPFLLGDKFIDAEIKQGKTAEQILGKLKDKIFESEQIKKQLEIDFDKLKEREKQWDINVYDFIRTHYVEEQLFYDPSHPTNILLRYIANQILSILKMPVLELDKELIQTLDSVEVPIYPCVAESLGLRWKQTELRRTCPTMVLKKGGMSIEEYVKEYIYWNYEL